MRARARARSEAACGGARRHPPGVSALNLAEREERRDLVRAAARNNAEWCDAFCRAHGIVGRFDDDAWWSAERTPPLYPDAVTLAPGVNAASLLGRIDRGPGCSIKDSFGDLDLAGRGFEVLFRAQWLWLETTVDRQSWSSVRTAEELSKWEAAWGADVPGFFPPVLLTDDSVAFLVRYEGDRIAAGAVANRSAGAIGLSNVFDAEGDVERAYLGGASVARERWGALPVVGYESGSALEGAHRAGFVGTGELAVWLRR